MVARRWEQYNYSINTQIWFSSKLLIKPLKFISYWLHSLLCIIQFDGSFRTLRHGYMTFECQVNATEINLASFLLKMSDAGYF